MKDAMVPLGDPGLNEVHCRATICRSVNHLDHDSDRPAAGYRSASFGFSAANRTIRIRSDAKSGTAIGSA